MATSSLTASRMSSEGVGGLPGGLAGSGLFCGGSAAGRCRKPTSNSGRASSGDFLIGELLRRLVSLLVRPLERHEKLVGTGRRLEFGRALLALHVKARLHRVAFHRIDAEH